MMMTSHKAGVKVIYCPDTHVEDSRFIPSDGQELIVVEVDQDGMCVVNGYPSSIIHKSLLAPVMPDRELWTACIVRDLENSFK